MTQFRNSYAKPIAEAALEIGAIELRPNKPFKWASGTYNPIYNDNRMLLASYKNRMLVCDGLFETIKTQNLKPDFICATSLSGIAPAASLVQAMVAEGRDVRLIILVGDQLYIDTRSGSVDIFGNGEAVCSTTPWAIPVGVEIANKRQLPFMYVRPKQKDHGKGKIIEGIPNSKDKTLLVAASVEEPEIYFPILSEQEINVEGMVEFVDDHRWIKVDSLIDKKVVVIEDLISTGSSALKEVRACRKIKAEVLGVVTIFHYELEAAEKAFAQESCPLYSVFTYDILLEVAAEKNMFPQKELEIPAEWRKDQPNWGDTHGFPAEPKAA